MNEITPGRYRHYKGNEYTVIGTARHSETLEEHVVYRQEYGDHRLWVRPKQIVSGTVKVDRQEVLRFQSLGSSSEQVGESVKNIFDDLPQHLTKEVVRTPIRAADVRIEPIMLSPVENGGALRRKTRTKMAAPMRAVRGRR
jgi:hypothetical protein